MRHASMAKLTRFIQTSPREWAYAQPYASSAKRTERLNLGYKFTIPRALTAASNT